MIVLRPGSGLCNRLRAMGSAIKLAREASVNLRVEWFRCPIRRWAALCGMRASFSDLFEPISGVPVKEKIIVRNDLPWNARTYSQHNPDFFSEERRGEFVKEVKADPSKNRWLWTCFPFYSTPDFSWVKPKPKIADRVNEIVCGFGDHCVGMHVRRTDNRAAIDGSPLSLFEEKIDLEIDKDHRVRFFLSTDDPNVKVELREKYGDRILFCKDVASRYTLKGEADAVVDLMLLAKTRKIYGSYWSSFSEVASQIGGIDLEVLVKMGVPLPEWINR